MARLGGESSPLSPKSPLESKIPIFQSSLSSPSPLRRTGSQRAHKTDLFPSIAENSHANHTPPIRRCNSSLSLTPLRSRRSRGGAGDEFSDTESVKSFGSAASSCCDHPHFALNGTTWSGRARRYLVHCSGSLPNEPGEYKTPTQRAQQELRYAQSQLRHVVKEVEEKDKQISQLTKELVELRLYKASSVASNSPQDEEKEKHQHQLKPEADDTTVTTSNRCSGSSLVTDQPVESKQEEVVASSSSLVDSGHFDASTSAAVMNSSVTLMHGDESPQHMRLLNEIQELKQNHNDRVEALLNQLSEMSTRYFEAKPKLDAAEARRNELEKEVEKLKAQLEQHRALLAEQDKQNKQMYLKMFAEGQEAGRIEDPNQVSEQDPKDPNTITVTELLKKLSITEAELENTKARQDESSCAAVELLALATRCQSLLSVEEAVSLWVLGTRKALYRRLVDSRNQEIQDPEIMLQFLKSAIYYFLTDKENLHRHLKAIESILGFTDAEKVNIDKVYGSARN